jgi:hypothetical protein
MTHDTAWGDRAGSPRSCQMDVAVMAVWFDIPSALRSDRAEALDGRLARVGGVRPKRAGVDTITLNPHTSKRINQLSFFPGF